MNPTQPRRLPRGPWRALFKHALTLVDEIARHGGREPLWTFGGGTALMLRYRHRRSRDIDIFVPDPQSLGHVSPRLSDVAGKVSLDYVEGAGYVKLVRAEGEIDFVAAPNLTARPFDLWRIAGREVRVETAAEIMEKKLWHRGDVVTARDIFDFSLVIEREPRALRQAARLLTRHRAEFLAQLANRVPILESQFNAIDRLDYRPTFKEASAKVSEFLRKLP